MNVTIKTSVGKGVILGLAGAALFYSGYSLGIEQASNTSNPRYMKDVHRRAKELIAKSANDVIRERREQRVVDAKFNDITKDQ
jgi:hypothetical protein